MSNEYTPLDTLEAVMAALAGGLPVEYQMEGGAWRSWHNTDEQVVKRTMVDLGCTFRTPSRATEPVAEHDQKFCNTHGMTHSVELRDADCEFGESEPVAAGEFDLRAAQPTASFCADGSLDLMFRAGSQRLLLNIPESGIPNYAYKCGDDRSKGPVQADNGNLLKLIAGISLAALASTPEPATLVGDLQRLVVELRKGPQEPSSAEESYEYIAYLIERLIQLNS